jgi:cytidylate kinase
MPNTKPFLIAIDGPNASGKGTLARRLGKELGFPVLDTGLLYRAVGWLVLQQGSDINHETIALHAADELHELITPEFLSNPELRSAEIGTAASIVSAFGPVRQSLFDLQRNFALHPPGDAAGAILDGRDIGTVICPDANIKFYVTAKAEIRTERRARELYGDDWQKHFDALLLQTNERDQRDSERATAPLKPAEDAVMVDTSDMSADEVFQMALELVRAKQN